MLPKRTDKLRVRNQSELDTGSYDLSVIGIIS